MMGTASWETLRHHYRDCISPSLLVVSVSSVRHYQTLSIFSALSGHQPLVSGHGDMSRAAEQGGPVSWTWTCLFLLKFGSVHGIWYSDLELGICYSWTVLLQVLSCASWRLSVSVVRAHYWPDAWQHCAHCDTGDGGGGAGISYKHCKHHNNHRDNVTPSHSAPAGRLGLNQSSVMQDDVEMMNVTRTMRGQSGAALTKRWRHNQLQHIAQSVESKRDNSPALWWSDLASDWSVTVNTGLSLVETFHTVWW